ncbi:MAG: hypothetical protein ACYC0B_03080 [Gemmatimonadaceae bacterium]
MSRMLMLALFVMAAALPLRVQDDLPVVLDSATIRSSAARTLSGLLAGRIAGLSVTQASGAPGLAPQVRVRGAVGLVGAVEPLLHVDGVLVRDDPYWLGPKPDGRLGHSRRRDRLGVALPPRFLGFVWRESFFGQPIVPTWSLRLDIGR